MTTDIQSIRHDISNGIDTNSPKIDPQNINDASFLTKYQAQVEILVAPRIESTVPPPVIHQVVSSPLEAQL